MALINCSDCNNQISDSADNCIHCGRPMRLSRESILAEIQNANIKRNEMFDVLDYVRNCEHYSPEHANMNKNAFDNIEKLDKRIQELEAMLK